MHKDEMNMSGSGKTQKKTFSSMNYQLFFLLSHEAVLVEITHTFITQLIFTQFSSSKIFNVHHENDCPFLSLVTDMEAIYTVILEQFELPEIK